MSRVSWYLAILTIIGISTIHTSEENFIPNKMWSEWRQNNKNLSNVARSFDHAIRTPLQEEYLIKQLKNKLQQQENANEQLKEINQIKNNEIFQLQKLIQEMKEKSIDEFKEKEKLHFEFIKFQEKYDKLQKNFDSLNYDHEKLKTLSKTTMEKLKVKNDKKISTLTTQLKNLELAKEKEINELKIEQGKELKIRLKQFDNLKSDKEKEVEEWKAKFKKYEDVNTKQIKNLHIEIEEINSKFLEKENLLKNVETLQLKLEINLEMKQSELLRKEKQINNLTIELMKCKNKDKYSNFLKKFFLSWKNEQSREDSESKKTKLKFENQVQSLSQHENKVDLNVQMFKPEVEIHKIETLTIPKSPKENSIFLKFNTNDESFSEKTKLILENQVESLSQKKFTEQNNFGFKVPILKPKTSEVEIHDIETLTIQNSKEENPKMSNDESYTPIQNSSPNNNAYSPIKETTKKKPKSKINFKNKKTSIDQKKFEEKLFEKNEKIIENFAEDESYFSISSTLKESIELFCRSNIDKFNCLHLNSCAEMVTEANEEIRNKINLLWDNLNNIKWTDPNYKYEFLFIHHGVTVCMIDELKNIDNDFNEFLEKLAAVKKNNIEMQYWWKKFGKTIYKCTMEEIKARSENYLNDIIKSLEPEKNENEKRALIKYNILKNYPDYFKKQNFLMEKFLAGIGYNRYGMFRLATDFENITKIAFSLSK